MNEWSFFVNNIPILAYDKNCLRKRYPEPSTILYLHNYPHFKKRLNLKYFSRNFAVKNTKLIYLILIKARADGRAQLRFFRQKRRSAHPWPKRIKEISADDDSQRQRFRSTISCNLLQNGKIRHCRLSQLTTKSIIHVQKYLRHLCAIRKGRCSELLSLEMRYF